MSEHNNPEIKSIIAKVVKDLSSEADRILSPKNLGVKGSTPGEWAKKVKITHKENLLTVLFTKYYPLGGTRRSPSYFVIPTEYKHLATKAMTALKKEFQDKKWAIEDSSIEETPYGYEVFFVSDGFAKWDKVATSSEDSFKSKSRQARMALQCAADDMESLRKVDVERVMETAKRNGSYDEMLEWVKAERPDLIVELDNVTKRLAEAKMKMSMSDIQKKNKFELLALIRKGDLSYSEVDDALEKIKKFSALDWIGDQLAKDELKPGASLKANLVAALTKVGIEVKNDMVKKSSLAEFVKAWDSETELENQKEAEFLYNEEINDSVVAELAKAGYKASFKFNTTDKGYDLYVSKDGQEVVLLETDKEDDIDPDYTKYMRQYTFADDATHEVTISGEIKNYKYVTDASRLVKELDKHFKKLPMIKELLRAFVDNNGYSRDTAVVDSYLNKLHSMTESELQSEYEDAFGG